MATVPTLANSGVLVRYELDQGDPEQSVRLFYFSQDCYDWFDETLCEAPIETGKKLSPYEISDAFIRGFVIGRRLFHTSDVVNVMPQREGVWELKPDGVRVFGWIWKKGVFIAGRGELKSKLTPARYECLINETIDFRTALDLDPPKFINGDNHELF